MALLQNHYHIATPSPTNSIPPIPTIAFQEQCLLSEITCVYSSSFYQTPFNFYLRNQKRNDFTAILKTATEVSPGRTICGGINVPTAIIMNGTYLYEGGRWGNSTLCDQNYVFPSEFACSYPDCLFRSNQAAGLKCHINSIQ